MDTDTDTGTDAGMDTDTDTDTDMDIDIHIDNLLVLTSRHLRGEGMRTSFSILQSTRIIPMGLFSKILTACPCSLLYLFKDTEKNSTAKK